MTYKVLIVDDSRLARMSMAKALQSLRPQWSRVEAANSDEALSAAEAGGVDLVMMDFNMPGRDGLALAAELRKLNPDMPLAIISANQQHEIVQRAQEVGAAFLPKPVTQNALAEFLDKVEPRLSAGSK